MDPVGGGRRGGRARGRSCAGALWRGAGEGGPGRRPASPRGAGVRVLQPGRGGPRARAAARGFFFFFLALISGRCILDRRGPVLTSPRRRQGDAGRARRPPSVFGPKTDGGLFAWARAGGEYSWLKAASAIGVRCPVSGNISRRSRERLGGPACPVPGTVPAPSIVAYSFPVSRSCTCITPSWGPRWRRRRRRRAASETRAWWAVGRPAGAILSPWRPPRAIFRRHIDTSRARGWARGRGQGVADGAGGGGHS